MNNQYEKGVSIKYRTQVKEYFQKHRGINIEQYALLQEEQRGVIVRNDNRFTETNRLFIQREQVDFKGRVFDSGIRNKRFKLLVQGTIGNWYVFDVDELEAYFKRKGTGLVKGMEKNGYTYYGSLLGLKKAKELSILSYLDNGKGNVYSQTRLL